VCRHSAFGVQDDARISAASAERSKSVVVGGDTRRRRASLCLGPDSELAKGDEGSSVLPHSQKPLYDKISLDEEPEQTFSNSKTISTAQWKLAQSTRLGDLSHEHDTDEISHDGALPPLSLSLTQRYHSDTLDEEAWAGSSDGGDEMVTNSLTSTAKHATTVAHRLNLGNRERLMLPDNNHTQSMLELLAPNEKARRGGVNQRAKPVPDLTQQRTSPLQQVTTLSRPPTIIDALEVDVGWGP
jgi:hypothetical protein